MKTILFYTISFLLCVSFSRANAQIVSDSSFTSMLGYSVSIGDKIVLGAPSNTINDEFAFVTKKSKKKFGLAKKFAKAAGAVGSGVAAIGGVSGSVETIVKGVQIGSAADAASSAIDVNDILSKTNNDMAGKSYIISDIKPDGDGNTTAVASNEENKEFIIVLDPAVATREILFINGKPVVISSTN